MSKGLKEFVRGLLDPGAVDTGGPRDNDMSNTRRVWAFLVERGVAFGSDLQLFWNEADAVEAARRYLSTSRPGGEPALSTDVYELIESANQKVGADEYLVLASFPVGGSHSETFP